MATPRRAAAKPLLVLAAAVLCARAAFPGTSEPRPPKPECSRSLPRRSASAPAQWGAAAGPSFSEGMRAMHACLSCHDGTVASLGGALAGHGGGSSGEAAGHPVGVDYASAMLRRPGEYNDPRSRPDIVLEGNRVTCVSCHSERRPVESSLPGSQTRLCLACHVK